MIITGNALHLPLADNSVQCCVTSPPYWNLRDYGTARWEGGDPDCDHKAGGASRIGKTTLGGGTATTGHRQEGFGPVCRKCGARRIDAQLGLEATPEEYVANMVAVFREVRRVLRADGTLWLNIGDSYAGSNCGSNDYREKTGLGTAPTTKYKGQKPGLPDGLKPKDLVGIPWRVAFALQADGWWLRSDIIWHKPNPMPESVTDRCTKAHEYVFMLTKSAGYYYDAEAVKEPSVDPESYNGRRPRNPQKFDGQPMSRTRVGLARLDGEAYPTRNRRDVWTITTKPFKGAHFATMPPDLAEVCIKAGTSSRGRCPECGAPWERVTEVTGQTKQKWGTAVHPEYATGPMDRGGNSQMETGGIATGMINTRVTTGWRPTCACDAGEPVPCVVLDPFSGAGTTVLVATQLAREGIGVELSAEYNAIAAERLGVIQPVLWGVL